MYVPGSISVKIGTNITWENNDEILHTVTAGTPNEATDTFDGELDGKGSNFSHVFTEPGEFSYFCNRHNGMRGTITVTS